MIFALELRDLRNTAALTYVDLARKTHYSASWLSRTANGIQKPAWPVVEAFVAACGGDVGYYAGRYDSLLGGSR
ncbi:helix-turn-helix domain-containing protein [Lentzea atacamensis]|uniref:helix-turn-helix domain-containing protein n=1 Tax=Lentzea atacamensis TaxID=531938 RepID=UPI0014753A53|nr:helix-turn-helix transcriptional regulator [Lentzea atacamensis]